MAARKFGIIQRPKRKPFLDITELKLLIDHDFWSSPTTENAQQAVAWLQGICCAARPGYLARPRDGEGYLTCGNITIRGGMAGEHYLSVKSSSVGGKDGRTRNRTCIFWSRLS